MKNWLPKEFLSKSIRNRAETMSENINTIINLGLTGAILAIFILYLFLRNFKIVTFIAVAIPISVFSAFYFFTFSVSVSIH